MRLSGTNSLLFILGLMASGPLHPSAYGQTNGGGNEFFESKVRPLLISQCYSCHSDQSKTAQGGLRLDSRAGLVKGGSRGNAFSGDSPEKSLLVRAVQYSDPSLQMPPKGKLSEEQVAILLEWVKKGAVWPQGDKPKPSPGTVTAFDLKERAKHWAWQPPRLGLVPQVKEPTWGRNPVDAFLMASLEKQGIKHAEPADRRTLIRRLTYDITGLPPTVAEIHAYLEDKSPNSYEKLVDRLLASPHYGERWARHWLDLVRYAETDGHEWDQAKQGAFQYRDYLIRAFNADVPFNLFVSEHLAGDLLPTPRINPTDGFNESILATGFLWLGSSKHSPVDFCDDQAERIDNQIDVIGKAFLGLTLGCARCHNHKFDAISSRDYYGLFGFLKSTRSAICSVAPPIPATALAALVNTSASAQKQIRTALSEELVRPFEASRAFWRDRLAMARNTPTSSLYPIAILCDPKSKFTTSEFQQRKQQIRDSWLQQSVRTDRENAACHWLPGIGSDKFANGWSATGDAFGSGPHILPYVYVGSGNGTAGQAVYPAHSAFGGALSEKMSGTLRSPTFVIGANQIHYHTAGKNARIRLVVEGYVRKPIEIIYGGLSLDINGGGPLVWQNQDVSQYKGHRAYVEFITEGSGYIAVDRVGLSDASPPSDAPDPAIMRALIDSRVDSVSSMTNAFCALMSRAATVLTSQHSLPVGEAQDLSPLLCELLKDQSIPQSASAAIAQRAEIEREIPVFAPALASADGTGETSHVYLRGSYKTQGPLAPRRFLEVCDREPSVESNETSGRLTLAQRLTASSDPLLARVIVNRVWQHHFGEGIVRTPDDFGVKGDRPTHPELLDWLAVQFTSKRGPYACDWSLKKLHRLMLLTLAYRMSSQAEPNADARDPQNRLLHKMPLRRLEAEAIRDGILTVSGRLDRTICGAPVMPNLNAYTPGRGAPNSGPLDGGGRRSIYISVRRNFLVPLFLAFDYPVPVTTIGHRTVSNVPAQALALLNNPFVVEQSNVWAKRALTEQKDPTARINSLYEAAFARLPSSAERAVSLAFLADPDRQYGGDEQRAL